MIRYFVENVQKQVVDSKDFFFVITITVEFSRWHQIRLSTSVIRKSERSMITANFKTSPCH